MVVLLLFSEAWSRSERPLFFCGCEEAYGSTLMVVSDHTKVIRETVFFHSVWTKACAGVNMHRRVIFVFTGLYLAATTSRGSLIRARPHPTRYLSFVCRFTTRKDYARHSSDAWSSGSRRECHNFGYGLFSASGCCFGVEGFSLLRSRTCPWSTSSAQVVLAVLPLADRKSVV